MDLKIFGQLFSEYLSFKQNCFHPLVWINGDPIIGKNVSIGGFSEINAKETTIKIGDNCDIASFVAINVADSHKRCIGLEKEIKRKSIIIENNVFIGSHSVIKGGAYIGHHSVVAAGTIVEGIDVIPPYSLIVGNPMIVKERYYEKQLKVKDNTPY